MKIPLLAVLLLASGTGNAGVFKCTNAAGKTQYQAKPCAAAEEAFEMNIKTGTALDLNEQRKKDQLLEEKKEQVLQQEQARKLAAEQRKKDAKVETEITQMLIKSNPKQYSAFAIPPYNPDNLPELVQQFEGRLPEIEKMRRLAAQKALQSGECDRVEANELNMKSKPDMLVFLVDCSSGKSFYFNETELAQ